MLKTLAGRQFLSLILLVLSSAALARAQESSIELSHTDRRQIIEALLKEKFKETRDATIYISMANLSEELRSEFPVVKNKKIRFLTSEEATQFCAYEFGAFEIIGRFVSISFGNCTEGLAYDFEKFGDRWKSVVLTIPK